MRQTILITGSTDGIGKLAAIKLAKDGHQLYLHGRNSEKLSKVIEEVKSASNNTNIDGFVMDLADLNTVKKVSDQIKSEIPSLDILINNAGVFKSPIQTNELGMDIRMAVNYFAPYIMTNMLLPKMHQSSNPRIINLSSAAQSPISQKVLIGKEQVSEQEAYAQSKLAILMWSFYLSKSDPDISVIALNPGSLLNTNMVREAYGKFWSPAEKGSDIIYDIAVGESYKNETGKYFDNDAGRFNQAHEDAYDLSKIENLMIVTDAILTKHVK